MIDQADIEGEIEAGLPNEKERLSEAFDAYQFSEGRFEAYPTRSKDGRYNSEAERRSSPVFRRVVEVLTQNLYKAQPTRKLRAPDATEWLAQVYKQTAMAPKWHRADQLSLIGGFAGFQFSGTPDPAAPIRTTLWGAHELVVWLDPDDATRPEAVAVIDQYDGQRRLRLYTEDEVVTYLTSKGTAHVAAGGTAYREIGRRANTLRDPDGRGVIPFSFVHWQFPAQVFTTNGPGPNLTELNQSVNERLDRLGDAMHFLNKPIGIATGVDEAWRPPASIKPGDFLNMPPTGLDAAGNGPQPSLSYLMPPTDYIGADWTDLNNYLDHSLEMHGVPPVLIRMIQSGARSGASIQAEQLPLLAWVEARRSMWSFYEDDAARMAVTVGAAHLGRNNVLLDAGKLGNALADWQFTIHWPQLYVQLPGPERDQADDWRLDHGLVSKIGILMERGDYSEDEAFEVLLKVQQQNDRLKAAGIEPGPPPVNPFGPPPTAPGTNPPANPPAPSEPNPTESNPEANHGRA